MKTAAEWAEEATTDQQLRKMIESIATQAMAQARDQALEEAAKECRKLAVKTPSEDRFNGLKSCEHSIRALKAKGDRLPTGNPDGMNAVETYHKADEAIRQLNAMVMLLRETYGARLANHHVDLSADLLTAQSRIATQLCFLRARSSYWAVVDGASPETVPIH